MAFFYPRTIYHTQTPFTPVFHVLSSRSNGPSSRNRQCSSRTRGNNFHVYRRVARPWNPRFEVSETSDAWVLHGDLPGLNKDQVTVDFPEAQKLVVHGTLERKQTTPNDSTEQAEASASTTTATPAASEAPAVSDAETDSTAGTEDTKSVSSYQATVEDDVEGDDFEMVDATPAKPQEQPAMQKEQAREDPKPQAQAPKTHEEEHEQSSPALPQNFRAERTIGQFTRTFTFPSDIDYDSVTADLKDGLLKIVVPKAKRPEPRRIAIN